MRRAAKVDESQPDGVKFLREAGFSVLLLHTLGRDIPDSLVARKSSGFTALVEWKTGSAQLTEGQREWRDKWGGHYIVANSGPDALAKLTLAESSHIRFKPA